jgi:hypothetical protein
MRSNLKEITKITPLSIINLFNFNQNSKIIPKTMILMLQLGPHFPLNSPKINPQILIKLNLILWWQETSFKKMMIIRVMSQRILQLIILKSIMSFLNIKRNQISIINSNTSTILNIKWFKRTNFNRLRKRLKVSKMTLWSWIYQIWKTH